MESGKLTIRFVHWLQVMQSFKGVDDEALTQAVSQLSLRDLNPVLYRCDAEERDDNNGNGSYHIPGHGTLIYAGLQVRGKLGFHHVACYCSHAAMHSPAELGLVVKYMGWHPIHAGRHDAHVLDRAQQ
jgi:hypothetical protein